MCFRQNTSRSKSRARQTKGTTPSGQLSARPSGVTDMPSTPIPYAHTADVSVLNRHHVTLASDADTPAMYVFGGKYLHAQHIEHAAALSIRPSHLIRCGINMLKSTGIVLSIRLALHAVERWSAAVRAMAKFMGTRG